MDSKNDSVIHIVLAISDPRGTYSRHAGVVMASIFDNTKSQVCVHILHDKTLTDLNRSLLAETAETFGQQIEFYDVVSHIERMEVTGYEFRLLSPDILPLDKVIYLDCDIVVNVDIRELWDISVDDCYCAGVLYAHASTSTSALIMKNTGIDRKVYVNSGVLLMNLSRIREKCCLIQEYVLWVERYRHISSTLDQDFINSFFQCGIKILESRFNNHHTHRNSNFISDVGSPEVSNSILHALIPPKPWDGLRGSALDRLYWKYFFKTPWGRLTPEEIANLMIDMIQKSPLTHRKTAQCYAKIFSRLRSDILHNGPIGYLRFFIKELYNKTKRVFSGKPRV